jgi:hypothetical protein
MRNTSQAVPYVVACLDVGSPQSGNVGWALLHGGTTTHGQQLPEFANRLVSHLKEGHSMALGFECPLYIPKRDDPMTMTKARLGERGVNWCGGPGGSVLATGLAQVNWVLRQLAHGVSGLTCSTRWKDFRDRSVRLFIWEAFITKGDGTEIRDGITGKVSGHERDAVCGAKVFESRAFKQLHLTSDLRHEPAISLIGMHLLSTGLTTDWSLLNETCVVLKIKKPI